MISGNEPLTHLLTLSVGQWRKEQVRGPLCPLASSKHALTCRTSFPGYVERWPHFQNTSFSVIINLKNCHLENPYDSRSFSGNLLVFSSWKMERDNTELLPLKTRTWKYEYNSFENTRVNKTSLFHSKSAVCLINKDC